MLGTVKDTGLAGKLVVLTFVKPAMIAPALQAILYWLGLLVVALYVKLALVVPLHTLGLLPNVIVGSAFTVTPIVLPVEEHPVVLLVTVKVPV